jgi:hypothetical protein
MASLKDKDEGLIFPHRQNTRLRVSVATTDESNGRMTAKNRVARYNRDSLEDSLRDAKREVVEREIFQSLVKEAGKLPTISAKVSERLIVIDAAQGTELVFELVKVASLVRCLNCTEHVSRRMQMSTRRPNIVDTMMFSRASAISSITHYKPFYLGYTNTTRRDVTCRLLLHLYMPPKLNRSPHLYYSPSLICCNMKYSRNGSRQKLTGR